MNEYVSGHRSRAKASYLRNRETLDDYELLELLLMYSIPRIDVKPLAKDLLKRFITLEKVFGATPEQLMQVKGIGENSAILISLFSSIERKISKERNVNVKSLTTCEDAMDYFKNLLVPEENEKIVIVTLNNASKIIAAREITEGTVNMSEISTRKILENIITDNAADVIVGHNHPHGNAEASAQDVNFTISLRNLLSTVNVGLLDHIIVSDTEVCSMRSTPMYVHYFTKQ